ncbi:MAG: endonuclease/exonuclease/phosphatase family protein [Chloroflexota bacterium]
MAKYTLMTYNIQHMNRLFANAAVKPGEAKRAEGIAKVIQKVNPHLLGICEAANDPQEHRNFIENYLPEMGFQLAQGVSRGAQNLVFYYRQPFSVLSLDENHSYYDPWHSDTDDDGLEENYHWERRPLEATFEITPGGPKLDVLLVHTKSKGIFTVVDFQNFQKIALANRKRLVAQAIKLRSRLNELLTDANPRPIVVMGDLNDGPGLDAFESMLGKSFVETVMGSVFEPDLIFHNVLWWMSKERGLMKDLWTADFPDPIVNHPLGYRHQVWVDHILVSPDMVWGASQVRYVDESGRVGPGDRAARTASDHRAVHCQIEVVE